MSPCFNSLVFPLPSGGGMLKLCVIHHLGALVHLTFLYTLTFQEEKARAKCIHSVKPKTTVFYIRYTSDPCNLIGGTRITSHTYFTMYLLLQRALPHKMK